MNTRIKVMVVEDEIHMQKLLRARLKNLGFDDIIVAGGGKTALQLLEEEKVDLIISDWDMPGMNGLYFLRKIRADDKYKDIPFLMLTGHKDKESILEAIKEGANQYIVKPFEKKTLENKLKELLGNA